MLSDQIPVFHCPSVALGGLLRIKDCTLPPQFCCFIESALEK
jgi:hypothetical protein